MYYEPTMKPKLSVRKRSLVLAGEFAAFGAGAVILLVFVASTLDAHLIQQGQGAAVITSVLADLANTDRGLNHVGSLAVSPALSAIAEAKANDMAAGGYFAHTSPGGKTPWYWFQQAGYAFSYAGENLAIDFSDSADVEQAWMNSPTHRANLLNGNFTEIGIATAVGTYEGHTTTFVVEEFGTRARESASVTESSIPTEPTRLATAQTKPVAAPAVKLAAAPTHTTSSKSAASTSTPTLAEASSAPAAVLGTAAVGLTKTPSLADSLGVTAFWDIFAASPKTTLRYAYYLFGLIILAALIWETGLEIKMHHRKHIALAALLLVLMGSLFFAADRLVFTDPVLADAGISVPGTL